ncbi:putative N-acetylmannosamine-6-phosphate 2-epimerase [Anaerocolumna cellulosilytica]|uniref:Putative N-acetylmannosamine-6-phosphate 2-epimerase n=1 Tax=Anaerocolumna cellulosilytica TaxID=433286 RepID=A0A6S6R6Y5_9FIRM|nr:N-acetylmannosamine-6-phosphate 2-epimerase [Anaerocolumna cellulosilytica]MBB5194018.1 N-acylglucosamine-6-phosphate 2-epimerase [Anaerocolumna cellulosilytica]BCJ94768.1 putative N-acetylmannosamine-6-phosphate 2-epimerase [Anaerocolumna cellulosilytica]
MDKFDKVLEKIKGGLIVSCQALEDEPLHSSYIMARMAYAAWEGGACGIRANSPEDIKEIKKTVPLPVIGLYKQVYTDSKIYITPTLKEVDRLSDSGADIIAMDATNRLRPTGISLQQFFKDVKSRYPKLRFMADCSNVKEAEYAQTLGFDVVGTTLCGYTDNTKNVKLPAFGLLKEMTGKLNIPVIAEGGIWTPEQLKTAMDNGAYAAVIGTAITRPRDITRRFVDIL